MRGRELEFPLYARAPSMLYRPPLINRGNAAEAGRWLDHIRKVYPDGAEHIIKCCAHHAQRLQGGALPHRKLWGVDQRALPGIYRNFWGAGPNICNLIYQEAATAVDLHKLGQVEIRPCYFFLDRSSASAISFSTKVCPPARNALKSRLYLSSKLFPA